MPQRSTCLLFALVVAGIAGCGGGKCPSGTEACNGVCVQLDRDDVNCGACGKVCSLETTCQSGACALACPAPQVVCGGACINPRTSTTSCGASEDCKGAHAGTVCAAGQACVSGTCALICPAGQLACGGACVNPQASASYCGASGDCTGAHAGAACAAGQTCVSGTCALVCPAGLLACGGACVNPQTSANYCGASGDCTGAHAGSACTSAQGCVSGACSCQTVALDLDTPFATGAPPFTSASGQQTPTALWASTAAPLPTNTSWENLVLGAGGSRVDFLPYQIKAEPVWLDVANAAPTNTPTLVSVPDLKQIMLGANEFGAATTHVVQSYDLFSVTLRYSVSSGTMTAPLVYGMPYVTVDYAGLQPVLLPGTYSIASVNGSTATGDVSGSRFALALSDGSTWVVYTSSSVTLNWTSNKVYATARFTGTLRVANLPTAGAAAVLDAHAGTVPRGGSLSASVGCDVATLRFDYTTSGAGPLLLAAMPHHLGRLLAPTLTGLTFSTMSGTLTAVEGSTWTMSLPLSTIGWTAPRAMAPAHLAAVRTALASDAGFVPDPAVADDTYFHGKQLAKLARLALIADELGETATAATLRARLAPLVADWLDGTNANHFVYDTTWGGVVTTQALANPGALFGQGHYNDHHFHYGYLLYAAAALAKVDPGFATSHRPGLLALVRDIANPSAADTKFPRFRSMDFFRGHSWASGLSEFADGQNQESTSEAVNAWYGLLLLGLATGDNRMTDLGRVLLALEVDSARTYWQVPAASAVYPDPFAQNRCVGILFETKAAFATFFGAEPYKIYGIQLLPFTPASEELISPAWVGDAWPKMQSALSGAPQGWQGFLHMAHATTARETAWTDASALSGWDDGNSQTNTLWWVASRP